MLCVHLFTLNREESGLNNVNWQAHIQSSYYQNQTSIISSPQSEGRRVETCAKHLICVGLLQITRVPVQTCNLKTDCQSCIELKDPYCGWCVLEGR